METRRAAGLNFAPDKAYPRARMQRSQSFCALSATIESRSEIDLQSKASQALSRTAQASDSLSHIY
jgi:hypothetical protein